MIHNQTKEVFIPICLSHSPIKPGKDFIIVFRTSQHVQSFSLDGWFTSNIEQLAKKFVVKTVKSIAGKEHSDVRLNLDADLKNWYTNEKLNLIGGF